MVSLQLSHKLEVLLLLFTIWVCKTFAQALATLYQRHFDTDHPHSQVHVSEIGEEVKQLNFDRIPSEFQSPSLIVFYSTITISYLLAVSAEL